nr:MAG TPA_asm: minor tail protein [Caudoviricetes sp.]
MAMSILLLKVTCCLSWGRSRGMGLTWLFSALAISRRGEMRLFIKVRFTPLPAGSSLMVSRKYGLRRSQVTIKGLEELRQNLSNISKNAIPRATSQSINRVAGRAISRSSTRVAKETKVKRKLVMQRAKLKRASPKKPMATIRVNRGNLPAIKLGHVRVQLSRRKRDSGSSGSVLKIGNFSFPGAFVQQLNNGRWHVLRRTSKSRYPVEVVKIPLSTPLTTAFKEELPKLIASDMQKEMLAAIKNQIRLVTK